MYQALICLLQQRSCPFRVLPKRRQCLIALSQASCNTEDDPIDAIEGLAKQLLTKGVDNVIVKLGERGALWVGEAQLQHWVGRPVEVVDTTAAGDCFNGAFAVGLAEGRGVNEAGAFAVAASALSVTRHGAQDSMPMRDFVEG